MMGLFAFANNLSVNIIMPESVQIGQVIQAQVEVSGGIAPYKIEKATWEVYEPGQDYPVLTKKAVIDEEDEFYFKSSFTPKLGTTGKLVVKVSDADKNMLEKQAEFDIHNNAENLAIAFDLSAQSVQAGDSISADWQISGGQAPYEYKYGWQIKEFGKWISDNHAKLGMGDSDSADFTPAYGETGRIYVAVTDADGKYLFSSKEFSIQSDPGVTELSVGFLDLDLISVEIGAKITAEWTISGGQAPYSSFWQWYVTENNKESRVQYGWNEDENTRSANFTPNFGQIGRFELIVSDALGRSAESDISFAINGLESTPLDALITLSPVGGIGVDQAITASWEETTGGEGPYTYDYYWIIHDGDQVYYAASAYNRTETSSTFTPPYGQSGSFELTVSDAIGRKAYKSIDFDITGAAPSAPLKAFIQFTSGKSVEVGEAITANWTVTGGTGSYTYDFNWIVVNRGNYNWPESKVGYTETSASFTPRYGQKGTFELTVRDEFGRSFYTERDFAITGYVPLSATITLDSDHVTVKEKINAAWEVTGGTAPYEFNYHWEITDAGVRSNYDYDWGGSDSRSASYVPRFGQTGRFVLYVYDSQGDSIGLSANFNIEGASVVEALTAAVSMEPSGTIAVDTPITVTWVTEGGAGGYSYDYHWEIVEDYNRHDLAHSYGQTESGATFTPKFGQRGAFFLDIYDAEGRTTQVVTEFTLTGGQPLVPLNAVIHVPDSAEAGEPVTATWEITGEEPFTVVYLNWGTLRDGTWYWNQENKREGNSSVYTPLYGTAGQVEMCVEDGMGRQEWFRSDVFEITNAPDPLSVGFDLSATTVEAGGKITAFWTISGGKEPVTIQDVTWHYRYDGEDGWRWGSTDEEWDRSNNSSSFIPREGTFGRLQLEVEDGYGVGHWFLSPEFIITGSPDPIEVEFTLSNTTVAVGDEITGSWTISGGNEPEVQYVYWLYRYDDEDRWSLDRDEDWDRTDNRSSFTPREGSVGCLQLVIEDGYGAWRSFESEEFTITGSPDRLMLSIDLPDRVEAGQEITASWIVSGNIGDYEITQVSWGIQYADKPGQWYLSYPAYDRSSSAFSPWHGVKGIIFVTVTDESGRSVQMRKEFFIDGALDPASISIQVPQEVQAGTTVTATWQLSGGSGPFTIENVYWEVSEHVDSWTSFHPNYTDEGITFTPVYGNLGRVTVVVKDGHGCLLYGSEEFLITNSPEPLALSIDMPITEVAAGTPITATWTIEGGSGSYTLDSIGWYVFYNEEGNWDWQASEREGDSSTFTPKYGNFGQFYLALIDDETGRSAYAEKRFRITGSPDPLAADFVLPGSVGVGEQISLVCDITGGVEPVVYVQWYVQENEEDFWTFCQDQTLYGLDYTAAFTPGYGVRGRANVRVGDESGQLIHKELEFEITDAPVILLRSISLDPSSADLDIGDTLQLEATVLPENASNKSLEWTSSDLEIAKVDENGLVTALSSGTATITAAAKDGSGVSASCEIDVKPRMVETITLSHSSEDMNLGGMLQLTAAVLPVNASNKSLAWTSSDPAVANVDEQGLVTALSFGTATVTAAATDGSGVSAVCEVDVKRRLVETVILTPSSAVLNIGELIPLMSTILPENADDPSLTWESSAPEVAAVDEWGTVYAISLGTATITATALDGSGVSATCVVQVKKPVETLTLSHTAEELFVGGKIQLTAVVLPEDASDRSLTWTSSNESVAQVDEHGLVTAKSRGTATITATARDGSGKSASCVVEVKQQVEAVTLSHSEEDLNVGEALQLTATIFPANANYPFLTWASSDPDIAQVDYRGWVYAISRGAATITATARDGSGKSAGCELQVKQLVERVELTSSYRDLLIGEELQLSATAYPEDANDPSLEWTSSDPEVAAVDADGWVTALSSGYATITATAKDGSGESDSCNLRVKVLIETLTLIPSSTDMDIDETLQLTAEVLPENASDRSFTWESDNESIAKVDALGVVTALSPGTASIRAMATDGSSKIAFCTVRVNRPVETITLQQNSADLYIGDPLQLIAMVLPLNATNRSLEWTSSDEAVAQVNEHGLVTALLPGTATITAKAKDVSGKSAVCEVRVKSRLVQSIVFAQSSAILNIDEQITLTPTIYPVNASDPSLRWESSKPEVAEVDDEGTVYAKSRGPATITATARDGSGVSAACVVQVKLLVQTLTLSHSSLDLLVGEKLPLIATIFPENADEQSLVWTSSDPDIAKVDDQGLVTSLLPGTVTITAATQDGSEKSAVCEVCVKSRLVETIVLVNKVDLNIGDSTTLIPTISPETAEDPSLTWASSAPDIAEVDEDGKVHAKSRGTATITATARDGSGVSATCVVQVKLMVQTLTLSHSSIDLLVGETQPLIATFFPENAEDQSLMWMSSDQIIARVNDFGVVTAVLPGTATITATARDGSGKSATCEVQVRQLVETITLSHSSEELLVGKKLQLTAEIGPENASDKSLEWTSSAQNIVEVDEHGLVTAVLPGVATITATARDGSGKSARCELQVKQLVETITLLPPSTDVIVGDELQLTAEVGPENASDKSLEWTSSAQDIAKVDEHGLVTAKSPGATTITATAKDGSDVSASCVVEVKQLVETVTLSHSYEELIVGGDELQLTATVGPANASDKSLKWTSSAPAIAEVDEDGLVTAKSPGVATIKATAQDGSGKSASCVVEVKQLVKTVTLSHSNEELIVGGDILQLTATVGPANASDKSLEWTSSVPGVVQVDEDGWVTGLLPGKATITATARDGSGKSASCEVQVKQLVKTLTLSHSSEKLIVGEELQLTAGVGPENASDKSLEWMSSDPAVAEVDEQGLVTALSSGTATITAIAKDGSGVSAECSVVVNKPELIITIDMPKEVELGKPITATWKVSGGTGDYSYDYEWLVAIGDVYYLKESVSGQKNEKATFTPTDGHEGEFSLTVRDSTGAEVYQSALFSITEKPAKFTLNAAEKFLLAKKTFALKGTVTPASAADGKITWKSSSTAVATVSASGLVTAKKTGKATITATVELKDGRTMTAECVIYVQTGTLSLNETTKTLLIGKTFTLLGTSAPSGAASGKITWKSSNTKIATVSASGVVKGIKAGTATITATVNINGGGTATAKSTVYVAGFTLNTTGKTLASGESFALHGTLNPASLKEGDISWKSSNTMVATVDEATGLVTAKGPGSATITATVALQGGETATATCAVYVFEGFSLNAEAINLAVGTSLTLKGTLIPPEAANGKVTWKSSNSKIATVSASGVVKGIKAGTATITATVALKGGGTATATCAVYVMSGLKLNPTTKTLLVGTTYTLTGTLIPPEAANEEITWKSSDEEVASVSPSSSPVTGSPVTVMGKKAGTATITATVDLKGGGTATATCTVYVREELKLNAEEINLAVGKSFTLKTKPLMPPEAANGKVTWKSNNTKIATVSASGVVKGIKAGQARITATVALKGGGTATATCEVYVMSGLKLNTTTKTLLVGTPHSLTGTLTPSGAANGDIIWISSDESVASVDKVAGLVTANGTGSATITATVDLRGGGIATAKCTVYVREELNLNAEEINLAVGKSFTLKAKPLTPPEAANGKVTWKSSNTKIATVSASGVVKGIKAGMATITATVALKGGGTATATCAVYVMSGLKLNTTAKTLLVGEPHPLTGTLTPSSAANGDIRWISSNETVASVDEVTGLVTSNGPGSATITATVELKGGGEATAKSVVTVTEFMLNASATSVQVKKTFTLKGTIAPSIEAAGPITWKSSNNKIATVSASGVVKGVKAGKATVTATVILTDGRIVIAKCVVTVK